MIENYYVLGTHTNEGLFFITEATGAGDEIELKASNDFGRAYMVKNLELCKDIVEAFEHEATLNVYRVSLKEVSP